MTAQDSMPPVTTDEAQERVSVRSSALLGHGNELYDAACSLMRRRFVNNDDQWQNLENAVRRYNAARQSEELKNLSSGLFAPMVTATSEGQSAENGQTTKTDLVK